MTLLEKRIRRAIGLVHRGQALVVSIERDGIHIKGARQRWANAYVLPWAAAYDVAVKMKIVSERRAKVAARKARRAA